jgi:hypothetical protein
MSTRRSGKKAAVIVGVIIGLLAAAWIVDRTFDVRDKQTSPAEIGP